MNAVSGNVAEYAQAALRIDRNPLEEVAADLEERPVDEAELITLRETNPRRQHGGLHLRRQLEVALNLLLELGDLVLRLIRPHDLIELFKQARAREVLVQVIRITVLHDLVDERVVDVVHEGGQEDDRNPLVVVADHVPELEPVHRIHHDVGEHGVEPLLLESVERLLGVVRRRHLKGAVLEAGGNSQQDELFIIQNQYVVFAITHTISDNLLVVLCLLRSISAKSIRSIYIQPTVSIFWKK